MKVQPSHSAVAARFNAAARSYHKLALVQTEGAHALLECIPPELQPRSLLEIGCGTGLMTELLSGRFPGTRITALDIAGDMLREAERRLGSSHGDIRWQQGDVASLPVTEQFDAVVSHAALHWMRPLSVTFSCIANHMPPSACFMFGLMMEGTLAELHEARNRAVPQLPVAAGLPSTREVSHALAEAGFGVDLFLQKTLRVVHADAWDMMRTIHAQGLTGGDLSHGRRLLTRHELAAIAAEYNRSWRTDAGVPATYQLGLVRAYRT